MLPNTNPDKKETKVMNRMGRRQPRHEPSYLTHKNGIIDHQPIWFNHDVVSNPMPKKMQETPMSEKTAENKLLHDWSFMVMQNPPAGVREKSLQYFRDNPVSVTIRPGRSLRPAPSPAKRKTEVGVLSDGIAWLRQKPFPPENSLASGTWGSNRSFPH
jgi:hypothetical protein